MITQGRYRLPGLSLSAKLITAYTVIVILVAGILSGILYVQLCDAQQALTRERLQDTVSLTITRVDGDFHSLLVAPEDMSSSYYRIIQSELQSIQKASTAITRITTLRARADKRLVVVVDLPLAAESAAPIGQPVEVIPPLLAAGLDTITHPVVEAIPITLPSGAKRFYGYAPIMDQSGRQDGVLAIELDVSPLLASETHARNMSLLTFLLILPFVLFAGIWLMRKATAPIGELLRGAERITQGQLDYRVPVQSDDELGALATAFNTMTTSLQVRIAAEHQARQALDSSHQQLQDYNQSLEQAMQEQQRLSDTVRRMSLPVIPIADQIIVLPLIGTIDIQRAHDLFTTLLTGIEQHRARVVLFDLTGVTLVDDIVAQVLLDAMRASRLLGTTTLLVGIRPEIAQTFVHIGADMNYTTVSATLQSGLLQALALTGRRLVAQAAS